MATEVTVTDWRLKSPLLVDGDFEGGPTRPRLAEYDEIDTRYQISNVYPRAPYGCPSLANKLTATIDH